jgi:ADP-ribosylglycohydrolase
MSAGNGAAMRSAVIGVFFHERLEQRQEFGRALAEVTHRDDRAVEGAMYVAEVAAVCASSSGSISPECFQGEARGVVKNPQLCDAIDRAVELAGRKVGVHEAAETCGNTGFVVHTVPFALFCLLRFGDDPLKTLQEAISAGGDTDSIGAILGGWLGTLHGEAGVPGKLINRIHDGPFGPSHLRKLATYLSNVRTGEPSLVPRYSQAAALTRNLALYPVILGHGLRRILPF